MHQIMVSSSALMLVMMSGAAMAQTTSPAVAAADDDSNAIVVTARNREERLQDVPLAISAVSGESLERQGVDGIRDLAYITSGVTVRSLGAEYGQRAIFRGQGDLSAGVGDPNVSVFFDGVYQYNTSAISMELTDIERVEVVKGPVSALYGRNAAAGAINYVTRRPGNDLRVKARLTGGEDGYRVATALVSGPIVKDVLALGIGGTYSEFDGSYKDSVNGNRAGGYRKKDFQVTANFTPVSGFTAFATYYRGRDNFGLTAGFSRLPNCGIPQGGSAASPTALPAGTPGFALFSPFSKYCGEFKPAGDVQIPTPAAGATGNNRRIDSGSLRLEFVLPGVGTFTALTGTNKVRVQRYTDFSGGVRAGFDVALIPAALATQNLVSNPPTMRINPFFGQDANSTDVSQELRLQSEQHQAIRWQLGAFYYNLNQSERRNFAYAGTVPAGFSIASISRTAAGGTVLTRLPGLTAITSPSGAINPDNSAASQVRTEQGSVFAAVDVDLLKGLAASGEIRQTWEQKRYTPLGSINFNGPSTIPATPGFNPRGNFKYHDYRVSLKYEPTRGLMVYGSMATGTKSGGFNTSQAAPGFEQEQTFRPERNTTYELGGKFTTWENRFQFNLAAFRIDSNDVQVFGTSDNPNNPGLIVRNLAKVRTYGFEADAALKPMDGLRFNLGLGYANPKIRNGTYQIYSANPTAPVAGSVTCALIPSCAPGLVKLPTPQNANPQFANAVSLAGNQTPGTSKWQVSIGTDLDGPISGDLTWFAHADYRYEARQFVDVENISFIGARNLFNLRAGIRTDHYSLTAFVENLTNNQTPEGASYNSFQSDRTSTLLAGALPIGRLIGVTLGVDF